MDANDTRLEAAIPAHLQTERTRASKCPFGARPYPTYVARFDPAITRVVIGYFGIQYCEPASRPAIAAARDIERLFALPNGPGHWDAAVGIDQAHAVNCLYAAYWNDGAAFRSWHDSPPVAAWWNTATRESAEIGCFREIFSPRVIDFETHFSTHVAEGVAALSGGMSGEIAEHAYWGSARDRIPLSQVDGMDEDPTPVAPVGRGRRLRISPRHNLCIIRSGQDWSDADLAERDLYDRDLRPPLERGMRFLRDEGHAVGCISNRFVEVMRADGAPALKSYGVSYWKSLAHLEAWAASHPTHLAIFGAGTTYMRELGPLAGLRTYHEIAVVRSEDQFFEYVNCHARTGMLAACGLGGTEG